VRPKSPPFALAGGARPQVHAKHLATPITKPFALFSFDKIAQSTRFNTLQIFNHAHAVIRAIASVQPKKQLTGETGTVSAEIASDARPDFAVLDPAIPAGLRLPGIFDPATRARIPLALIRPAKTAIHTARSD